MVLSKLRPWWNPFSVKIFGPLGRIVTPNQLTVLNFLFGVLAGYLIYINQYAWAALCVFLSIAFDGMDGAVSRASGKKMGSGFGAVLDAVFDRLGEGFIFWGLVYKDLLALPALMFCYAVSHIGIKEPRAGKGFLERGERMFLITIFLLLKQIHWGLIVLIGLSILTIFQRLYSAKKVKE